MCCNWIEQNLNLLMSIIRRASLVPAAVVKSSSNSVFESCCGSKKLVCGARKEGWHPRTLNTQHTHTSRTHIRNLPPPFSPLSPTPHTHHTSHTSHTSHSKAHMPHDTHKTHATLHAWTELVYTSPNDVWNTFRYPKLGYQFD